MKTEIEVQKMLNEAEDIFNNSETIPESIRPKFLETILITIEVLKEILK